MRLTDLELYRWRFHNDMYIHTVSQHRPDNYPMMTWSQYWKEYGAFVSVLPRQSGKSQMLVLLAKSITNKENELSGDYLIVCDFREAKTSFIQAGLDWKKILNAKSIGRGSLSGIQHSGIHLMIDEFDFICKKNHLIHVLNHPWKSVTMVSTLK